MKTAWKIDETRNRLASLIEGMSVPENRRDLTKKENIRWLNRNLAINNSGPEVEMAQNLIVTILRRKDHE